MTDAYVIGVDMIKFGRFPDRSVPNIAAESALLALDDLTLADEVICLEPGGALARPTASGRSNPGQSICAEECLPPRAAQRDP